MVSYAIIIAFLAIPLDLNTFVNVRVAVVWVPEATFKQTYSSRNNNIFTSKAVLLENGYITSSYAESVTGGLGNNLFGMLALVGIAGQLKRNPYIKVQNDQINPKIWKMKQLFPKLYDQLVFINGNEMTEVMVTFANNGCCRADSPERLESYEDEYLKLQGSYFQSFKYFDHLRQSVREWLAPTEKIQRKAEYNLPLAYRDRFLICVHTRRGDFITDKYHAPSDSEFSTKALRFLFLKYEKQERKLGAIVLGDDRIWKKQTFTGIPNVYVVEKSSPEEDLALTRNYCNVTLLTASSSTFGFFLGYTTKSFDVYYRDINSTKDKVQNEMNQADFYPFRWTKLREEGGIIVEKL